jgi:tRNA A37 methylthiotransferase MiaB
VPELVKHLHLPVQSGSDRILAAMKRNHTALEYKSKLRKLRAAVPGICISSDFIVGFPGETEKDFEQTMKLIQDVGFDFPIRSSTASVRYAGRRSGRRHPGRAEKRALERLATSPEPARLRNQPTNGRVDPADSGHRLFEKRPRRAARPDRK